MNDRAPGNDVAVTPAFSVVIPVYNGERYIGACVQSVFDQDWADFEVIVVDDCSTDRTAQVCAAFLQRQNFSYRRNERNLGSAGSRNAGIALARGRYLAFLDADDRWYANFLGTQWRVLQENPHIRCLCSDFDLIDENDAVTFKSSGIFQYERSIALIKHDLASIWESSQSIIPSAFIAERSLVEALGGFSQGYAEDVNFWLKVAGSGVDIYETPVVLASYRLHSAQKTGNTYKMRIAKAEAYRAAAAEFPRISRSLPPGRFRQKLNELYRSAADFYFWIERDYALAAPYYRQALGLKPTDLGSMIKLIWCYLPDWLRRVVRSSRSRTREA